MTVASSERREQYPQTLLRSAEAAPRRMQYSLDVALIAAGHQLVPLIRVPAQSRGLTSRCRYDRLMPRSHSPFSME
jgi:hypothetical protein